MDTPTHRRIALLGLAISVAIAAFVIPSLSGTGTEVVAVSSSSGSRSESPAADGGRSPVMPLAMGAADGVIPDGSRVSVFDEHLPAIANLDPQLLIALRGAATDAEADGVELRVNSGWRSAEHQEQLWREAVAQHGSEAEAARWVAPPGRSAHVTGDAVDVGPEAAARWLGDHGSTYGLCRTYDNEPWHFELRPNAVDHGCPRRDADPTEDPRIHP